MGKIWAKIRTFIAKILFKSVEDWMKGIVIAFITFLVGNGTGWFVEKNKPIETSRNIIGTYVEGYIYPSNVISRAIEEMGATIEYNPTTLEDMRACTDLSMDHPPEGIVLLRKIESNLQQCIRFSVEENGYLPHVIANRSNYPSKLSKQNFGGDDVYFCGCSETVIRYVKEDESLH